MWLESILILLLSYFIWQSLKKPSSYPPGPWGLPLIGCIPSSLESYCKKLWELKEKHSDAISWRIGSMLVVVLFDYNLIKEVFQSPQFAARPDTKTLSYIQGKEQLGIILTKGDRARNNRRFILKHLRDFGMGKPRLVNVAHYEAECLVKDLKKQVGRPAPIPHSLIIAVLNIVWQMIGNKRYEFDETEIVTLCTLISATQVHGSKLVLLDIFPWLKKWIPHFILNAVFRFDVQIDLSNQIRKCFVKHVEEHMKDLDETNPRDFIDSYLIEMNKQKSNPDSTFSIEDLLFCMADIFLGATETTDLTLSWAMLYLAKFPQVQARLQKELNEFLPKETSFSMNDKSRLPYTEAFIHELLRFSSVSMEPPREALTDSKLGNYFVPKGTYIFYQTLMIHNDSRYFDSPEEFRPERFLDSEGKFVAPKDGFAPFGLGNRVCIGESIARMELFVFITKLVQNFHFEYPPGEEFNLEGMISPFFRPPKGSPNIIVTLR